MMHQLLSTSRPLTTGSSSSSDPWTHDTDFEAKKEATLAAVLAAKRNIRQEIAQLQDKLRSSKDAAAKLKTQLARGAAAASAAAARGAGGCGGGGGAGGGDESVTMEDLG